MNPAIAALVSPERSGADDLLAGFALGLRYRGWRVRGLVQEQRGGEVILVDLDDGTTHSVLQDLGRESRSCRLDDGALAEASGTFRRIVREGADLAVFNRFSGRERQGQGFRAEMLNVMAADIPLLTIVPERHLGDWRIFTGGLAEELPLRLAALEHWFASLHPAYSGGNALAPGWAANFA